MVAVVFDVCLPKTVWVVSSEPCECSSPSELVGFRDELVLFEDCVDASVADLDALRFQVGFDCFAAPAFSSSDLKDSCHSLRRYRVGPVWSSRRIHQPLPSVPVEPAPPVMNRAFRCSRMF